MPRVDGQAPLAGLDQPGGRLRGGTRPLGSKQLREDLGPGGTLEEPPPKERLPQGHAQRELVGPSIGL